MVVLDLVRQVDPGAKVLTLDTGRLPEETYEVIEAVRSGLGLEVEVVAPDPADVAAMVARHGPNLFHKDPALRRLCCHVRKVAAAAGPGHLRGLVDRAAPRRRPGQGHRQGRAGRRPRRHPQAQPAGRLDREAGLGLRAQPPPAGELAVRQGYTSIGCAPAPARPGPARTSGPAAGGGRPTRTASAACTPGSAGAAASPDDRFRPPDGCAPTSTLETTNGC